MTDTPDPLVIDLLYIGERIASWRPLLAEPLPTLSAEERLSQATEAMQEAFAMMNTMRDCLDLDPIDPAAMDVHPGDDQLAMTEAKFVEFTDQTEQLYTMYNKGSARDDSAPVPHEDLDPELVKAVDREIDESLEYRSTAPPARPSPAQTVWRVQLGERTAFPGEVQHSDTLYIAALTGLEALAAAALVIAHPETPYPASLEPRNARALPAPVAKAREEDAQDSGPL